MSNPFNRAIDGWVSIITPEEDDCRCRCEPRYYDPEPPPAWLMFLLTPIGWVLQILLVICKIALALCGFTLLFIIVSVLFK